MGNRRIPNASAKAYQESQRFLRCNSSSLSIKEATETMTRQMAEDDVAAQTVSTAALSVHDLTQRLVNKVTEEKKLRVESIIRRVSAQATGHSSVGKRSRAVATQSFKLDIRLETADHEEELCVVSGTEEAGDKSLSPLSMGSRGVISPTQEHSQASQRSLDNDSDSFGPPLPEDEDALVEKLRRKHDMARMTRHASVSPDSSNPIPPPSAGLVTPFAFPKSPVIPTPQPTGFVNPVGAGSYRYANQHQRLALVGSVSEAERLLRHNSYENATTKNSVTFTSIAKPHRP